MTIAIWNVVVLAANDNDGMVGGNFYFKPESVNKIYLHNRFFDYECPWKGYID